jgi:hypothetical protein
MIKEVEDEELSEEDKYDESENENSNILMNNSYLSKSS